MSARRSFAPRGLSLHGKITFWFSCALLLIVLCTYFLLFFVSGRILQKTIRDNLIEAAANNYNDIRFHDGPELPQDMTEGHFLPFGSGYLEIDDDFLDEVSAVYTALYDEDHTLIYGENPISRAAANLDFAEMRIQSLDVEGTKYYVLDRRIIGEGLPELWMRSVVSSRSGTLQMSSIIRLAFLLFPTLVIVALAGGSVLVRRMLHPIQDIADTARTISEGADLSRRIELGKGRDELHRLADTFNEMFDRLNASFETERRFVSDASHELRTPMSVITAQCDLALEKPRSAREYEEALLCIRRQSGRMNRLIREMLDFTRLESGVERFPTETLDLARLTASVCSDLALLREKNIELTFTVPPALPFTGSRNLLTRLLSNLIMNAYRYGKDDGHIHVELRTADKEILLIVTDDGIGIREEELTEIFRRFYRSDSSRSGEGLGLGLSMANEIARFHHGRIEVQSEYGKGSTFTVLLPADSQSDN